MPAPLPSSFTGFSAPAYLPIHWGDQDPQGHLNNVDHLRYLETTRIVFLQSLIPPLTPTSKVQIIVKSLAAKYKETMTYPDTFIGGTKCVQINESDLTLKCIGISGKTGRVAVECEVVLVSFCPTTKKRTPWPTDIVKKIVEGAEAAGNKDLKVKAAL